MPKPAPSVPRGIITVLAGVNGAGKSSVAGAYLRAAGGDYFNPDEFTRSLLRQNPGLDPAEANSLAWMRGKESLEHAIVAGTDFVFETTLGAQTIPHLLARAAKDGLAVKIYFVGLASVEHHLRRVAARVAAGGHDIPEAKIRERWENSRLNLVRLLPHLAELMVQLHRGGFGHGCARAGIGVAPAEGDPPRPEKSLRHARLGQTHRRRRA